MAQCCLALLGSCSFMWSTEVEALTLLCLRAFEGATYETRLELANLLGTLLARTQLMAGASAGSAGAQGAGTAAGASDKGKSKCVATVLRASLY